MEIDLVYLWVDGNDPQWQRKRNAFVGGGEQNSETNCKGRYANNDELKYSLRSAEKYVPWIRKIFIVTDNQIPGWLDTNHPKIRIVDHREILPAESLPCFNSTVIEYFLYKIPGLAEHFLLANDDTFFNAAVQPDFFFASDGFPIVRLKKPRLGGWRYRVKFLWPKSTHRITIHKSACLAEKKFGKYYSALPHHNVDAYTKSDYAQVMGGIFREEVEKYQTNHMRTGEELHRSVVLYCALSMKHGHLKLLKHAKKNRSLEISVHCPDYMEVLRRWRPELFCLNDNQYATDEDRARIKPFLKALFPEKSGYEK